MAVELLLHVKLECTCAPKKFVAACGEQIKDLGEQIIPFKSTERTPEGQQSIVMKKQGLENLGHMRERHVG